jgi:hypothetical protein
MINSGVVTPEVVTKTINGSVCTVIPLVLKEGDETTEQPYEWIDIILRPASFNYGGIVDAIVNLKYSLSEVVAILNNYLSDMTDDEAKREFDELQAWRRHAKEYAKKLLGE